MGKPGLIRLLACQIPPGAQKLAARLIPGSDKDADFEQKVMVVAEREGILDKANFYYIERSNQMGTSVAYYKLP